VTLEALSSGCPSIVEKKCGEHLVDHGVNGLTCQCGDAEGFYQVGVLSVRIYDVGFGCFATLVLSGMKSGRVSDLQRLFLVLCSRLYM
jgi:hypothetical protein